MDWISSTAVRCVEATPTEVQRPSRGTLLNGVMLMGWGVWASHMWHRLKILSPCWQSWTYSRLQNNGRLTAGINMKTPEETLWIRRHTRLWNDKDCSNGEWCTCFPEISLFCFSQLKACNEWVWGGGQIYFFNQRSYSIPERSTECLVNLHHCNDVFNGICAFHLLFSGVLREATCLDF